jgi:S-DNA-T family DNA segregation ATPase FtsK/SpoIIIE
MTSDPTPSWEVAVAGGLCAGRTVPLPPGGTVTVGRGPGNDLRLTDPEVSRRHLKVRLGEVPEVEDLCSRNGVILRGYQVNVAEIEEGSVVQVGETVLSIRRPIPADALLRKDSEGTVWFNRPPRIPAAERVPEVHIPAKPEKPRGFHFPIATVIFPLVAAGACYLWFPGSAYFLIFLALSPLMAIASRCRTGAAGARSTAPPSRSTTNALRRHGIAWRPWRPPRSWRPAPPNRIRR